MAVVFLVRFMLARSDHIPGGALANKLNKEYQYFLGLKGHMKQDTQTVNDICEFFAKYNVDPVPYFENIEPPIAREGETILSVNQSEQIMLAVSQDMESRQKAT
ncbi:MAG: hypothetical protein QGH37_32560 [Candidatus Poribacteria bacterium]|nr:hypothetical protein [Candidatus Poribacteria bacterium]